MRNIPPLDKKTEESEHVKKLVRNAIEKQPAEALLLSGGIDSSFLAALDSRPLAITIGLHSASADIRKAQKVVEHLGMRWHPIEINFESARQALMEIMLLTNSYDPGLINDIPVYIGMRHASSLGYKKVRSGEFADTIFLGYQYLWTISDVRNYISSLLPNVITSSKRIGDSIGVTTSQPYLDPQLTNFVNQLDREDNIVEVETEVKGDFFDNSSNTNNKSTWSKILLRRAALGSLPIDIVYRPRADLEFGSGLNLLKEYFTSKISDEEFIEKQQKSKYWDKMHASFHSLFTDLGLSVKLPTNNQEYACTWCGAGVTKGRCHCLTCGAYPSHI